MPSTCSVGCSQVFLEGGSGDEVEWRDKRVRKGMHESNCPDMGLGGCGLDGMPRKPSLLKQTTLTTDDHPLGM